MQLLIARQKKAGWVSQIVFELDSRHNVREALSQLVEMEATTRARLCHGDCPAFYQRLLDELIETNNNLKFDRCYSFNALNLLLAFPNAKPRDTADLAAQLAPLSGSKMRIPDLLRLYSAQTRFKRAVFRA